MNDRAPEDLACRDLIELVGDYLEGALPDAHARLIAGHLEICPGCAEYVAQLRSTTAALDGLGVETVETIDPAIKASLLRAFRDFPRPAGG